MRTFIDRVRGLYGGEIAASCAQQLGGIVRPSLDQRHLALSGAVASRVKPFVARPSRLTAVSPLRGRIAAGR